MSQIWSSLNDGSLKELLLHERTLKSGYLLEILSKFSILINFETFIERNKILFGIIDRWTRWPDRAVFTVS